MSEDQLERPGMRSGTSIAATSQLRPLEPYQWVDWLASLLARELAPSRRKFRMALRMATIGTVGTGLIAACHVNNQLGAYIVWLLVGAGPMLSVRKALTLLTAEAFALSASVVMARILVDTPWLMLPFLFLLLSSSAYIGDKVKLGAGLLLIQVVCLDLYYGVIFAPGEIGWNAAGAFGGSTIAIGVVLLFDNWLWPERREPLLLESLANSLGRVRVRFINTTKFYLNRENVSRPLIPPPTSDLPEHMALLKEAVEEGIDVHHHAVLVAVITRIARISLEVDRLMVTAREGTLGDEIGILLGSDIQAAVDAIAAALEEIERELPTRIPVGVDDEPPPSRTRARLAMAGLGARIIAARPVYIVRSRSTDVENFASFTDSLAALTALIERLLDVPPTKNDLGPLRDTSPRAEGTINPAVFRYSVKLGVCAVIGYVIGIYSQRPELSTILTTVLITALPTYGAAFRKMILRIIGAVIGGVISLVFVIIVSPNFETLPSYLVAFFLVFYVSAYSSLSSGRVAYAGKQIGTTFALVFAGLSPSFDIYVPLWRIWAILLGTLVVAVISVLLWPEYAGDSLLPKLRRVIADTLALAPGGSASSSEETIENLNSETMQILAEMLQIADDAQLEGRTSAINHDAVVEAAGNLRRIANRFSTISLSRLVTPTRELDSDTQSARQIFFDEVCHELKEWLDFFSGAKCLDGAAARALAQAQSPIRLKESLTGFASRLEDDAFARIRSWELDQRRAILAELNSSRRISVLLPELNGWFAKIPGTVQAIPPAGP